MKVSDEKPWSIVKSDPNDQPPMHDPARPWCLIHPRAMTGRARKITRHRTFANALERMTRDHEYRRLTRKPR